METSNEHEEEAVRWYVMRDLKRPNAKHPAYRQLMEMEMEIFVPMRWHLSIHRGKHIREEIPFLRDLLFVHESRQRLDTVVERTPTLQYRWMRHTWRQPMVVNEKAMERFILAVRTAKFPHYYLPEEITPAMCGRKIRIIGGPLNELEGSLLTIRGSKVKRLLVELPGFLAVGVDVKPEFIQFVEETNTNKRS